MTEISVVVASQDVRATLTLCLEALERQSRGRDAQIIVVDNSCDGSTRMVEEKFSSVQLVKVPEPRLIPELWAKGAMLASGRIVAFTTGHCVPEPDWLSEILRHHEYEYAAVGGAIENLQPSSLAQWAVYFCRYTPYMLPFEARRVAQIPGDNAAYKRWVLARYVRLLDSGFWETVINEHLRKDGLDLLLTPAIRVRHGPSFGVWRFCQQRVALGRIFGAARAAGASPARRTFYLVASPLVPFVFLGKILRQVLMKRRHLGVFTWSFPLLVLFVLSWSVGEFLGYVAGERSRWARPTEVRTHRPTGLPE